MLGNNSGDNPDARNYPLLELSAKVKYALLALMELASHQEKRIPLTMGEITAKQPIPERYLEQILTTLRRSGVVQSQRGSKGGYVLVREPWRITVLEVVTIVDGERKERESSDPPTPESNLIMEIWQQADSSAQIALSRHTIQDLCQERDARKHKNPMYYI
jgi:Rrf2 family protein